MSRRRAGGLRRTNPSNPRATPLLVLPVLLGAPGAGCSGSEKECDPPPGVHLEELYCQDGVRGYCREGGHAGDTVWEEEPCPAGAVCMMEENEAFCAQPDGSTAPDGAVP